MRPSAADVARFFARSYKSYAGIQAKRKDQKSRLFEQATRNGSETSPPILPPLNGTPTALVTLSQAARRRVGDLSSLFLRLWLCVLCWEFGRGKTVRLMLPACWQEPIPNRGRLSFDFRT